MNIDNLSIVQILDRDADHCLFCEFHNKRDSVETVFGRSCLLDSLTCPLSPEYYFIRRTGNELFLFTR